MALLKGRANYVCLYRLDLAAGAPELDTEQEAELNYVVEWSRQTTTGDIGHATALGDDARIWPHVTSTVDNCLGHVCDYFEDCFVVKARREAVKADIVVVNHHLLFADMALREEGFAELLPSAEAIVMDEAHHIPDVASTFFAASISTNQLRELCRDTLAAVTREAPDMPAVRELAEQLYVATDAMMRQLQRCGARGDWPPTIASDDLNAGLLTVDSRLTALRDGLELASDRGTGVENCYNRALRFSGRVKLFLDEDCETDEHWIRWFDTSTRGATLRATPMSVAEPFQQLMAGSAASWVFTSATLSVNGDFSHFKRALGIATAHEACWPSPFNYSGQGYLLLPRIAVEPRDPAYLDRVVDTAVEMIEAARGRTFILFTSYQALSYCARQLTDRLDYPLLVQGQAAPCSVTSPLRNDRRCRAARHGDVLARRRCTWSRVELRHYRQVTLRAARRSRDPSAHLGAAR